MLDMRVEFGKWGLSDEDRDGLMLVTATVS